MEDTDLYEWQRRPGFSIFCPVQLFDNEIVNEFYSARNLKGDVLSFFDSTTRFAKFTSVDLTPIIPKTTTEQGFVTTIGNMCYFSDGAGADMQKWDSVTAFSTINPSTWGIPAPTLTPTIHGRGCWLPFTGFVLNSAILDPNGSVEVVTNTYSGSGISGENQPLWPTTIASAINDGSIQWTNMGPLLSWLPDQFYPVPVVVLDTNGNLQLATVTTPTVDPWNGADTYIVGTVVSFGGLYWVALVASTNVTPSANYTVTSTVGATATTQPYWIQTTSPSVTGTYSVAPFAPAWNTTVGGTTTDGNYLWTNLGPGVLVESFGTSYVYCFRTVYGHLSTASPVSLNTGSIFGPQVATITSFEISGGQVIFQGVNNFIPGSVFSVQGLTIGTYLNNQSFIVRATGLTPTQFAAAFVYPDVPSTSDSGSTLNLIAGITGSRSPSPLCNATSTITATEIVAGVVTIYSINPFVPGLQVTLTGLTTASFLNNLQFQIINADPNGTWFQIYYTNVRGVLPADQAKVTDTGTATFNSVEIYRTSDGGGIYLFTGAVTNPTAAQSVNVHYDSGSQPAGQGVDDGVPGTYIWANSNNVTTPTLFATVTVPPPTSTSNAKFTILQTCGQFVTETAPSRPRITTVTASFGVNVTAGNSILLFVTVHNNPNINPGFSISDNQGNVYTLIASQVYTTLSAGATVGNFIYLANNVAGGATTVTFHANNINDTAWFGFSASECSGLVGTAETPAYHMQATGLTMNTGTVTTAVANEVVISFLWNDIFHTASDVATPPGAWNLFNSQVLFTRAGPNFGQTYQQSAAVYQVQHAVGTFTPIWETPGNHQSNGITIALPLYTYLLSDGLDATQFDFAVPAGITISEIEITFDGTFTGTAPFGVMEAQLLQGGTPIGSILQVPMQHSTAAVSYTFGGPGNIWGINWASSDFNDAGWGVRFTATQRLGGTSGVFGVSNVHAHIAGDTGTGWSFSDFTTDDNLNILQIAPQNHLNDPPPGAPGSSVNTQVGTVTAYWQGRIWMVVGNFVYFSAGPDCTNGVPEEAWPPANRFQFAGPVINLVPTADGVGILVYLADRVAAILGGPETISFYATDALSNFGISNPNAIFRDGSTIGQFTTQKQYFELVDKQKQDTGEHISDYLDANFKAEKTYATMHRNGLDVGIFLSNGVDKIVRYGSNIGAWSVPAFPQCGAGALASIETSVGIYSLMLASPIGGVTSIIPATNPRLGASIGTGTPWLNPSNITLGSPTTYATITLTGGPAQILDASKYLFNVPANSVIRGVQLTVIGTGTAVSTGAISAGLWTDVATPFGAPWSIATPNVVTLNAPPAAPVPNNTTNGFTQSPAFGPALMAVTASGTAINIGDTAFVMLDLQDAFSLGPVSVVSFVDDKGNIWTPVAPLQLANSNLISFVTYSAVMGTTIPISSTLNITVTFNENCRVNVMAFTNVPGLLALDKMAQAHSDSVPNPVSGSITIGEPEFVLSFVYDFVSLNPGTDIPAGWTAFGFGQSGGESALGAYFMASPGTVTDQWTSSWPWAATMVSYKFATASSPSFSDVLASSTYGFSIPAGAGITGVEAQITGLQTVVSATTLATATLTAGGVTRDFNFTTSSSTISLGGATDLWGAILTPSIVNSPGFGLTIQVFDTSTGEPVTFTVSAEQITVWYASPLVVRPRNAVAGAESQTISLGNSNTTVVLGSPTDLWGMPWVSPSVVNDPSFGFQISVPGAQTANFAISEMQVEIFYQSPGNYLFARDINSWGDNGQFGQNNGTPYPVCNIVIGSITLAQLGGPAFPLQHIVGYFNPAGTLEDGAPSRPDMWILPNEVNDKSGIGFIYLPEIVQEPPQGQNHPSESILALRWNVNMMNSQLASQFVHHLQVKIQFEPENAPNTIKAIAFCEDQNT